MAEQIISPKLAKQVHKLEETKSGEKISLDYFLSTLYDQATQEVVTGCPPVHWRFNSVRVRQLNELFKTHIIPASLEYFLVEGQDVGAGLFSFADFKEDKSVGLYLTSRMVGESFFGFGVEFYLGIYETPPDYGGIFLHGVKDKIYLHWDKDHHQKFYLKNGGGLFGFFHRKTSKVARELYHQLKNDK